MEIARYMNVDAVLRTNELTQHSTMDNDGKTYAQGMMRITNIHFLVAVLFYFLGNFYFTFIFPISRSKDRTYLFYISTF
jgi:hypothetical protein